MTRMIILFHLINSPGSVMIAIPQFSAKVSFDRNSLILEFSVSVRAFFDPP